MGKFNALLPRVHTFTFPLFPARVYIRTATFGVVTMGQVDSGIPAGTPYARPSHLDIVHPYITEAPTYMLHVYIKNAGKSTDFLPFTMHVYKPDGPREAANVLFVAGHHGKGGEPDNIATEHGWRVWAVRHNGLPAFHEAATAVNLLGYDLCWDPTKWQYLSQFLVNAGWAYRTITEDRKPCIQPVSAASAYFNHSMENRLDEIKTHLGFDDLKIFNSLPWLALHEGFVQRS